MRRLELLQQRIDALTAAGVENPHHMLLAAHDAGMRAPDNMQMWDGTTSHGNHTVFTQAWAAENKAAVHLSITHDGGAAVAFAVAETV